ncbi:hypothetical protein ASG31_16285 [Chryseobacterium sp. Leaf404]|uniref:hypothetical protein n=1 Tax=unclassified Chryseobacterium TaxID=2593645 RepID=UPI0006F64938|nr:MULTISPECIES: hypothetical protein [unclassified Chryseobacterium]KQT21432.1 hypothetical protein ASG31_16285 [Chryseobacterium sp. Leaf404]
MKKGFIGFLILLFSCQSNDNTTIVGSWQLSGSRYGTGAEIISHEFDSEIVINFENNGNYREYTNGKQISDRFFINEKDFVVLLNSKLQDSTFYSYQIKGNKLILDEVDKNGSFICDEGCTSIYKRLKE